MKPTQCEGGWERLPAPKSLSSPDDWKVRPASEPHALGDRQERCLLSSHEPFLMLTASRENCAKRHVWSWCLSITFLGIAPPLYPYRYHVWIGSRISTQYRLDLILSKEFEKWNQGSHVSAVFLLLLLKGSWFTMLCQFLLYSKVTRSYTSLHSFSRNIFHPSCFVPRDGI